MSTLVFQILVQTRPQRLGDIRRTHVDVLQKLTAGVLNLTVIEASSIYPDGRAGQIKKILFVNMFAKANMPFSLFTSELFL